jgi:hypothetical protein
MVARAPTMTNAAFIDKVLNMLGDLITDVALLKSSTNDIKKALFSNGHPGLIEDHRCLSEAFNDHIAEAQREQKVRDGRKEFSGKVWLVIITMVVTNIGVIISAIIMLSMGLKK